MDSVLQQGIKVAFFLLSGALLVSFSIVTFIEGILSQIAGYEFSAVVFYFVSMCALGATFWTYSKAKKVLSTL